jgi:hypothetical protein
MPKHDGFYSRSLTDFERNNRNRHSRQIANPKRQRLKSTMTKQLMNQQNPERNSTETSFTLRFKMPNQTSNRQEETNFKIFWYDLKVALRNSTITESGSLATHQTTQLKVAVLSSSRLTCSTGAINAQEMRPALLSTSKRKASLPLLQF